MQGISNINFRDKISGWSNSSITYENLYGKYVNLAKTDDAFMNSILSNYILRPSCYKCQFKSNYDNSDITIGDFWKINKILPNFNDDLGVSSIIINSDKGIELIECCKENLELIAVPLSSTWQSALISPPAKPLNRDSYIKKAMTLSIKEANKDINKKKTRLFSEKTAILLSDILHGKDYGIKFKLKSPCIINKDFSKNKETCCGCEACIQKCPVKAISITYDNEGFTYPLINKTKCINCDLCIHTCPIVVAYKNKMNDIHIQKVAYAAKCNNADIRYKSASGGIFPVLASEILRSHGIVFGVAWENKENFIEAHHIGISDMTDISKLQQSKYVQSRIGNTFSEVETALKNDQKVLFSGTPCQISGLKAFLGKNFNNKNLITISIICHGVPSPGIFRKYQEEISEELFK